MGDGDEVRGNPAPLATALLHTTEWDTLDYLLIDSPPGTGDVPRGLYTKVPLHGAVVVTTPSRLAIVDVVRGVKMLARFRVPVVALVENMASFACDACGREHLPFGRGHLESVRQSSAAADAAEVRLPIVPAEGEGEDEGGLVSSHPAMVRKFDELAAALELATAGVEPVALPYLSAALAHHDLPHWPTEMATNELFR